MYLPQTKIDDAGLVCLKNMHSLNALCLTDTNITGQGLKALSEIDTLKTLLLDGTKITDDGLLYLSKMRQLELIGYFKYEYHSPGIEGIFAALARSHFSWQWTKEQWTVSRTHV